MIMRRSVFASAAVAASLLAVMGGVTPAASAEPTDDSFIDPANRCFFDLTAPSLVDLPGGAKAATATLVTTRCTGKAAPTNVVVCVSTPDGPGDCGSELNWQVAKVFVTASRYDGQFTAKGGGCWRDLLEQFQEKCDTSGPVTATL